MASTTQIEVTHDAVCPDISPVHCEELGGLPPHTHHQTMNMTRMNSLLAVGLGKGFQVKGEVPFDYKVMGIEYKDDQGKPYEPPYGGIHHRNETLKGLGDARVRLEYYANAKKDWVVGGGLGTTIPIGKTEEDPYELSEKSLTHQHIQMGSGTFNPVLNLKAIYSGHQWGMVSTLQTKLSLSENDKSYKPSNAVRLTAGPTYRATAKWMLVASGDVLHETQAYWGDRADPMSGRTAIFGSASVVYRFNTTVAMMLQGQLTAAQWSVTDQITQPFVGVAGITLTPQKR